MDPESWSRIIYSSPAAYIRRITPEDADEFAQLARRSLELHRPWIYAPTTVEDFDKYLAKFNPDTAEFLLILARDVGTMAGFVTISGITRAPYHRAILGYGAFVPFAGKGYMSEGLALAVRFGIEDLKLHRLEADIQPDNDASINLVKRLGFRREGYSPGFIHIDGRWRDHERWAITSDMIGDGRSMPLPSRTHMLDSGASEPSSPGTVSDGQTGSGDSSDG